LEAITGFSYLGMEEWVEEGPVMASKPTADLKKKKKRNKTH